MTIWNIDYTDKNGETLKLPVSYKPSPIKFEDLSPRHKSLDALLNVLLQNLPAEEAEEALIVLQNQQATKLLANYGYFQMFSVPLVFEVFKRLSYVGIKVVGSPEANRGIVTDVSYSPPENAELDQIAKWIRITGTQAADCIISKTFHEGILNAFKLHSVNLTGPLNDPKIRVLIHV